MNVINALKARSTVRCFKSDPVPKGVLTEILEAALRSPSWANTQPWEIFVAAGETLEQIRRAYLANFRNKLPGRPDYPPAGNWSAAHKQRTAELTAGLLKHAGEEELERAALWENFQERNYRFFGAPVVVYLGMEHTLSAWSMFDIGSLSQSIMLAAQEFGISSALAFMFVQYPDVLRAALHIPEEIAVVIGIALGYCDAQSPWSTFRSARRPLLEVARFEGF
jgi:nitroreductase